MRLGLWNTKVPIHSITTSAASVEDNSNGLVYTIDRHKENRWLVTGHRLVGAEQAAKTDLVVLLNHQKPLTSLKVVDNGRLIVATAGSSVVIGTTSHADQPSMKDITYVWREFECSEWISSIDIRVDDANETPNVPRKSNTSGSSLNVVVGGLKGAVFIYEDILNKLLRKERRSQTSAKDQISPRKLYWHRNAVSALKWSRDGKSLVSTQSSPAHDAQATTLSLAVTKQYWCFGSSKRGKANFYLIYPQRSRASSCRLVAHLTLFGLPITPRWYSRHQSSNLLLV